MKPEAWHSVTVVDETGRRGECSVCGPDVDLRRRERRGRVEWSCMRKHRSYDPPIGRGSGHRASYRSFNLGVCMECGFVAAHRAQIDIHHIDGDHGNNKWSNLVPLCANCHRLWHALGAAGLNRAGNRAGADLRRRMVDNLTLIGVEPATDVLVVDAPDAEWSWLNWRFAGFLSAFAEAFGKPTRLTTSLEHEGLRLRARDAHTPAREAVRL